MGAGMLNWMGYKYYIVGICDVVDGRGFGGGCEGFDGFGCGREMLKRGIKGKNGRGL